MSAVRGMWDAAKHPRGTHGRFGSGASVKLDRRPSIRAVRKASAREKIALAKQRRVDHLTERLRQAHIDAYLANQEMLAAASKVPAGTRVSWR